MSDLAGWLAHPVTVGLGVFGCGLVVLLAEVLQRRLADLGNVRFQGLVGDHEPLPTLGEDVNLAQVSTALRWLQVVFLALMWSLLVFTDILQITTALLVGILIPVCAVVLAQLLFGRLSEEGIAKLLRLLYPAIAPLIAVTRIGGSRVHEPVEDDEEEASDREIRAFLDVGEAAGIIEGEEGEILESLVEFFDTTVREVMTPRTEMVAVHESASWDDILTVFAGAHKSRVPVYRETIDQIVGVVNVKNLVKDLTEGRKPPVKELYRPCIVVPESKELGPLLREFQESQQQMAIVVDEYGGTAGLVTLEDVLEEIVGEIQDELDPQLEPDWVELEKGVYRLQGRAPLEVLEDLFEFEPDTEDVDTIGGLVFSQHGAVPEPGTTVAVPNAGLEFVVEKMDGRRIVSVTVQPVSADSVEEGQSS